MRTLPALKALRLRSVRHAQTEEEEDTCVRLRSVRHAQTETRRQTSMTPCHPSNVSALGLCQGALER